MDNVNVGLSNMDDLDFSNDLFLKKVTGFKQQIDSRLNFCRDGLQLTVDHISFVEQKREIEKLRIEKEFEKTRLQILYILDKRKKKLLTSLDQEINKKRQLLLNRVQIYQYVLSLFIVLFINKHRHFPSIRVK